MPAKIKYFQDTMEGAPTISETQGDLIALLDACLINGFNSKSVVSLSVTSNVATLTFSAGTFEKDAVVLVEGVTDKTELNGEHYVDTTANGVITFDATGSADGAATGTITVKYAPLGWTKEFSGTNKAVYRSPNVLGSQRYYRVQNDQTPATNEYALFNGYDSMTDIDTGAGNDKINHNNAAGKIFLAGTSGNRKWTMIGDDLLVYLSINSYSSFAGGGPNYLSAWGDLEGPVGSLENAISIIEDTTSVTVGAWNQSNYTDILDNTDTTPASYTVSMANSHEGLGYDIKAYFCSLIPTATSGSSGVGTYYDPVTGKMEFHPVRVNDLNGVYRGVMPGMLQIRQAPATHYYGNEKHYIDDGGTQVPVIFFRQGSSTQPGSSFALAIKLRNWRA